MKTLFTGFVIFLSFLFWNMAWELTGLVAQTG
jgi:hypothetical protein